MKSNFFELDYEELKKILSTWGEPEFRVNQIWEGVYKKLKNTPKDLTNLPYNLRARLDESFSFSNLHVAAIHESLDRKTIKTLFHLDDGQSIESVLMRYQDRNTLCISSQVGCAMGCVFCATGQMGFKRNLSVGEIIEQVIYYARVLSKTGEAVTNVVIMGMGEPFHNYESTLAAIRRLNHPLGMNLGMRRFTISTVGIVPMIYRFADEQSQINLAVSLHDADDDLRNFLIPVNKRYPLKDLMTACRYYVEKTHRRISFEWALIRDINDMPEQAHKLAELLKGLLCHVNVIPLNPTQGYSGQSATKERAQRFRDVLISQSIPCTIRVRRGIDIQAGCGQLAVREDSKADLFQHS
jgi:23S rRNA (adenine2503-C2)-methyltransferase